MVPPKLPDISNWQAKCALVLFLTSLSVTLFTFMFTIVLSITQDTERSSIVELQPAPDFSFPLFSGGTGTVSLSDFHGQPVVLNFWGSWCPPCRAEFPTLQWASTHYKNQGLVILGIAVQDNEQHAKAFLDEQGTSFMTGPDTDGLIFVSYGVPLFPTTIFITPDGNIFSNKIGYLNRTDLVKMIDALLAV
jgi:thiol-disulfide isomerase/thioredoxin